MDLQNEWFGNRESLHLFLVSGNFLGSHHLYKTSGSHHFRGKPYHSSTRWTHASRAQDTRRWSMGMMRRWGKKGEKGKGCDVHLVLGDFFGDEDGGA